MTTPEEEALMGCGCAVCLLIILLVIATTGPVLIMFTAMFVGSLL